jgi:hypothetical protein
MLLSPRDWRCYRRVFFIAGVVVTGAKLSARVVVIGETLIATFMESMKILDKA